MSPTLSIIVPLYNEEQNVSLLYEAITQAIFPLRMDYEIIFVDDGSQDKTFIVTEELVQKDRRLRVIKFRRNYGQTPAMQARRYYHHDGRGSTERSGGYTEIC